MVGASGSPQSPFGSGDFIFVVVVVVVVVVAVVTGGGMVVLVVDVFFVALVDFGASIVVVGVVVGF